jgi:Zn finger protein HypA/HybF involved in hydrogenase expression
MVLGLRDGSEVTLGLSIDRDEQLSFAALATTLRDATSPVEAPVAEGPPTVVRCPGCGAPVQPADAATVGCWRCERAVAIHAPIRERVRAAATLDRARGELLRGLEQVLRQPSANVANAWMFATMVAPYAVPVCLCAQPGTWAAWPALAMLVVEGANLQVARRAAFHRLAIVFAARPSVTPGAPLRCRSCAGPLPASDAVLVACPYCEADNVRALQLERPAALWASAAQELDVVLAAQRARVRGPIVRAALWAAVAVGSVGMFLLGGG